MVSIEDMSIDELVHDLEGARAERDLAVRECERLGGVLRAYIEGSLMSGQEIANLHVIIDELIERVGHNYPCTTTDVDCSCGHSALLAWAKAAIGGE
jgi:hypothetical protein